MRLPTAARTAFSLVVVLATTALLGACSSDALSPAAEQRTDEAVSPFVPSAASLALIGVSNGTYEFTVDPTRPQGLFLGANMLYLPANSICHIATSSYGAAYWNDGCARQTQSLKITAVVRNAQSARPSIDFYPAMRFAPETPVVLYMYAGTGGNRRLLRDMLIKYCDDSGRCIDESLTDASLRTMSDPASKIVFRRIKHFSGFVIASRNGEPADPGEGGSNENGL